MMHLSEKLGIVLVLCVALLAAACGTSPQSLIVGIAGTVFVILLGGDTAWPLAGYATVLAATTLYALRRLQNRQGAPT